ncbi:MAG: DNA helicase RecQ [Nitrospirae bacterium]|nr:DNA helicase RecQ [Nitrospirota bacterium]MDA1305174.1 DNA helicase RecQ [Nitrospirota bacterium]
MDPLHQSPSKPVPLLPLLKEHFGFTSFRPLQEEIIRDALAGRDVVALLPTGGGKSLCFQLPALARPGLTVVVSPLIALMKDQVDALQANGIAATCLNSSLNPEEARSRLRGLHQGDYRLLYIAPERLMLPGSLNDLEHWQVNLLAIDEAHCISEWGHDFRPEYRRLVELRDRFPSLPVMALTATATERVRDDILTQLRLRDSAFYVASFNRPNLTYRVQSKSNAAEQILTLINSQSQESGIVYCQSRKATESLAERLQAQGIKAQPYHAGLTSKERTRHQELFLRDEIQVICATIAFGMGINKPNVRFVIHYDLPKNLESYYQETGRAGRDGLPSECMLLFSAGDAVKQQYFINEKPSLQEQQIARTQLQQMVQYAECATCRRAELLSYFGEDPTQENCGGCDNCLSPRDTFDGTEDACTVLSCVAQIRGKSGFGVGQNHVIEVLTGANTEKVRRWGHERLAAYGSGKNIHSRPEWAAICRELIRLEYLQQTTEPFTILELTAQGRGFLRERPPIMLTKPMSAPERKTSSTGDLAHDEGLFSHLRQLRKTLADERDVPAYVIFSDVALRQMAREYPTTEREFLQISGVGNRKLQEFGEVFLSAIAEYVETHARQDFSKEAPIPSSPPPGSSRKKQLGNTVQETLRCFRLGDSVEQIAQQRGLVPSTIFGHLEQAIQAGEQVDTERLLPPEQHEQIAAAFAQTGFANLTGAKEILGDLCDYGQLRLFRAIHGKTSRS